MKRAMQAGFSKVDITPPLERMEVYGIGYWYQRNVRFKGIRDSLYARALVLSAGDTRHVVVAVDSIFDSYGFVERSTTRIAEELSIEAVNIFITCTHTHSSPLIERNNTRKGSEYGQLIEDRIVEAAITAAQNAVDAYATIAAAPIQNVLYNRRPLLSDGHIAELHQPRSNADVVDPGLVNDRMTIVTFRDEEGSMLGGLCHFGIHGVTVQCSELLSSDCFGRAIQAIERDKEPFVLLHLNGPCGDIDPILMGGEDELHAMTLRLTAGIRSAMSAQEAVHFSEMQAAGNTFRAARRPTRSESDLDSARRVLDHAADASSTTPHHSGTGYESFLLAEEAAVGNLPPEIDVHYQILLWGNLLLVGIGGEVFTSTGLELQAQHPGFVVMPVGLTHGAAGYLPLHEMYTQGGYEVACAQWCPIAPGEPERLFAEIGSEIQRITESRAA